MADSASGGRPRSKAMVRVDLENAYAKLGVSPLMTTEEIKRVAEQKRRELMRRRRTKSHQQFGAEEDEMTALQAIEDQIGTARAREKYDQANPQNELLTVQPAPHDRWLDPRRRDGLITAWLVEELGQAGDGQNLVVVLLVVHDIDPQVRPHRVARLAVGQVQFAQRGVPETLRNRVFRGVDGGLQLGRVLARRGGGRRRGREVHLRGDLQHIHPVA